MRAIIARTARICLPSRVPLAAGEYLSAVVSVRAGAASRLRGSSQPAIPLYPSLPAALKSVEIEGGRPARTPTTVGSFHFYASVAEREPSPALADP